MTGSCERFPVGTGYKVSDINIEEEKDDSFKFKPNILPNSNSEANITSRERNSSYSMSESFDSIFTLKIYTHTNFTI
jgi:hypothetical protein